jgi:RNA polymerase sigma-70 factor (ECF subfamily)
MSVSKEQGGEMMSDLVSRLKKGDREAFNELVKQYEKQVINIAYGMLSDREDSFDAAQEVFIRIYKSIGSFKGQSSLTTWIYRVTANICNDMLRKRQRTAKTVSIYPSEDDEDAQLMELRDDSPTPEEVLERNEAQKAVREGIASLSDDFRAVITLCDMEGLSYEDAAAVLSVPHGTVKSRLNRARNALKKKLSEKRELF